MSTASCYEAIVDSATVERRARRGAESARIVEAYERAHNAAVELGAARPECRPGIQAALADRAFECEDAVRTLIADHLQTLNELRDTGQLERAIGEVGRIASQKDFAWRKTLAEAGRNATKTLGIDPGLFERAAEIIERHGLEIAGGEGGTVEGAIVNEYGKPERFAVRGSTRPGDPGRVSVDDLLGPGGIAAVIPVPVPDDCHHRLGRIDHSHLEAIDAYKVNVAGLALARETSYRHARTMAEVGPSAFRGEDPVTALVVGVIVVGVIVAGIGVALVASGDARGWFLIGLGVILIGGAICVAVGACAFVAGVAVAVEA